MPAPEGYTSLGVIGYTDKGTYAAGTTYNRFNVVLYNGSSYVAVKDGLTGVTPANDGVNWRLFANGFPDNGVTTDNFQNTLENYLDQTESTATNRAPSSAYLKEIKDGLDNDISELTSSSQLIVEAKSVDFGIIPANGNAQQTVDITKDGYSSLGIVGWSNIGASSFFLYQLTTSGNLLNALAYNTASTATSRSVGINAYILYRKNNT